MYCNNCGNYLSGIEKYCSNCGKIVNESTIIKNDNFSKSTENARSASIVLGGLSLGGVFFVIFAPISLILSIIGLVLAIKANKNYKNTIGIVLNSIGLFLSFIITSIFILLIYFTIDTIKDGNYDFDYIDETNIIERKDNKF